MGIFWRVNTKASCLGKSFVFFNRFVLNFLGLLSVGNFQPSLIMLIETIILKSIHGNGRLEDIFEINKAKEKFTSSRGSFLDETDALEARVWAENICFTTKNYDSLLAQLCHLALHQRRGCLSHHWEC
jgi:hypothetical protein